MYYELVSFRDVMTPMPTPVTIRPAVKADADIILRFVNELAEYEKAAHEVVANVTAIEQSIFGAESTTHALICEHNGEAIGFAVYFFNYSTWLGKNGLYLEDLYITPHQRGNGAGKQLLKHLARIAVDKGCGRFEWSCLDWNQPAIEFYQSVGAKPQEEWVTFRLAGSALADFADA